MPNPFEQARARLRQWLDRRPGVPAAASEPGQPTPEAARDAFQAALILAPGISRRLAELEERRVLARLVPELSPGSGAFSEQSLAAVSRIEQLLTDSSPSGKRYGAMLRELSRPDLLILALLLRGIQTGTSLRLRVAQTVFDRLQLPADSRHLVESLLSDDLRMSKLAFRPDADDPQAVEAFASYLNGASLFSTFTTEEHLKMLCLLTLATIDADGALTPLKAELLWRLFVDTYNQLMKAYGDQLIDAGSVRRTTLNANRPVVITEDELVQFLEGLPKRYLTLFDPESIYEHVRLCRDITADDVHCFLKRVGGAWELTVATLDKPFLFSNVCGVLSFLGMDILSGQALTNPRGLVLDVFRFNDPQGSMEPSKAEALLAAVVAGRTDINVLLQRESGDANQPSATAPVVAFDNEASHRFTVLEIVAQDAPGLLYRISRALSTFRCEIEMVVISTEEGKAIDVFHVTRDGAKIADSDELQLTEILEAAAGSVA